MIPDKVLYTDGRGITVTDTTFQVKKTSYLLNGITKHGLFIVKPERLPGVLLLVVGVIVAVIGFLNLIPASLVPDMQLNNARVVVMSAGGAIALIGIFIIALVRERYAVRIATAEGEKNAVVSDKKEYIAQIVNALHEAFTHNSIQVQDFAKNF